MCRCLYIDNRFKIIFLGIVCWFWFIQHPSGPRHDFQILIENEEIRVYLMNIVNIIRLLASIYKHNFILKLEEKFCEGNKAAYFHVNWVKVGEIQS